MALGSYNAFINSMLELRNQRLQEERYKQLERMEQQEQFAKTMSNMGQQFGNFAQQMGQNRAANQLMNQYFPQPPRAQAVKSVPETVEYAPGIGPIRSGGGYTPDLAMQQQADIAAQGMPGFYTGGTSELKMRIAMEKFKDERRQDALQARGHERAEEYLGLAKSKAGEASERGAERLANEAERVRLAQEAAAARAEAAEYARSQKHVDTALKTWDAATDEYKAAAKNAEAYNSGIIASMDGLNNAVKRGDEEGYLSALSKIDAHYQAATNQKLKVPRPQVATWAELQAAAEKQKAIDAANAGYWFSSKATEQADAAKFQKELEGMPGYQRAPGRISPQNYLATPAMEEPKRPDVEALRAQATTPAQAATAAAPKAKTVSVQEGTRLIGKPVRSGQKFTDPATGEVIIIQ